MIRSCYNLKSIADKATSILRLHNITTGKLGCEELIETVFEQKGCQTVEWDLHFHGKVRPIQCVYDTCNCNSSRKSSLPLSLLREKWPALDANCETLKRQKINITLIREGEVKMVVGSNNSGLPTGSGNPDWVGEKPTGSVESDQYRLGRDFRISSVQNFSKNPGQVQMR